MQTNTHSPAGPRDPLGIVLDSLMHLRLRSTQDISFTRPLLLLNGQGLIWPNTVNIVQGKTGTHKSRLVESVVACLLAKDGPGNHIGLEKSDPGRKVRVVYVDTERNESDQLPYALQQIKRLAGFSKSEQVPGFEFFSLIRVPREQRHEALMRYLALETDMEPGTETLVVLDVVTDCVANFNDPRDSMACLLYTSPSPRDRQKSRMPSSA